MTSGALDHFHMDEDADVHSKVHVFNQEERKWKAHDKFELVQPQAIEVGAWNRTKTKLYMADDTSQIYVYDKKKRSSIT